MKLGLGTGTTARHFVDLVGERVKGGLQVVCVGTSKATEEQAKALGIPLSTLDDLLDLDLTVDGADEVDPQLRLIKGGGGALLREKIVAAASKRMAVIVDSTKLVRVLGAFPLPIEVVPFGGSEPFITDGGHYILDCSLGAIDQPERLGESLSMIPGVVEHGLFVGLARTAIIAGAEGVQVLGDPD